MVLRAHQDKTYPGAMVASLSVPWGNTKEEREGYHLVWPRDLVECAGALLAVGATREAGNTLRYLRATQLADGHWNQNQWLGGKPYWTGIQLDETALPVLLAAALAERDALEGTEVEDMVRRALSFIVRHGPASDQDRWEESAGLNTFTLAACIAALVGGAQFLRARCARAGAGFRGLLEFAARGLDRGARYAARAEVRHSGLLRARGSVAGHQRSPRVLIASCRSGIRRWIRVCRPPRRSASIFCSSCASVCAAPTIR